MEVVSRPVRANQLHSMRLKHLKQKQNKCDLCHHREAGPACIEVCPTHALVCIDRDALEEMVKSVVVKLLFDTGAELLF